MGRVVRPQTDRKFNPTLYTKFFRAKMNIIGIQNPKLIVTNDYQQFLAHFEWFLALLNVHSRGPIL